MLAASAITPEHAQARGYETITDRRRLGKLGIVKAARNCVPGLLVPMLRIDGSTWGYQYRPDVPRWRNGRIVKYETPYQQRNGVDVPPGVADWLGDPSVPLWVTEGVKKADCGAHYGLCIVALPGVWSWMGTNTAGGKVALPDWRDIALNNRRVILAFDGDVARKESVQKALHALADYLAVKGANVEYLWLPDTDGKTGLDDYLVDGHTVDDLLRLVKPDPPPVATETLGDTGGDEQQPPESEPEPVPPISLDEAHEVFRRWFGNSYDTDAFDITLGTAAVERLDGDPVWVMLISGSGAAKTETVQPLIGIGATITSSISSAGALLSATSKKERTPDATGGLLPKIGERGVLVIKDFTTILSMDRNARAEVLAALRRSMTATGSATSAPTGAGHCGGGAVWS